MSTRTRTLLVGILAALALVVVAGPGTPVTASPRAAAARTGATGIAAYTPPIRHVFVINIENKGYVQTWGAASKAPYLAKTLRDKGVLLNYYYGTAHNSQPNYVAQISGQGPNPQMQADCGIYSNFHRVGWASPGQAVGHGCVFPASVPSLPRQLTAHHLSWKGYMQDMGTACRHPALDTQDMTQKARKGDQYATRHNPFMYFHSIIDHPTYCKRHVVPFKRLVSDLRYVSTTPNLSYITPNLCADGHDSPCVDGRPGGLASVNVFMRYWVPKILASPAFKRNGVLIITADESDGSQRDASACCGEGPGPNTAQPGVYGPGGGRIGALVISKWTKPHSWATKAYNHYSLLRSIEDVFRLPHLGYAASAAQQTRSFGLDVYNSGWNN